MAGRSTWALCRPGMPNWEATGTSLWPESSSHWPESSSPGAFRYRIQNHRALDIAHDHDHDQSVLHDVLIDAKH